MSIIFRKIEPAGCDADQLRLAMTAAGVALWSWNVDTNGFAMDERAFDLWGVPLSEFVTFDGKPPRRDALRRGGLMVENCTYGQSYDQCAEST